jgi:hypothetical protein
LTFISCSLAKIHTHKNITVNNAQGILNKSRKKFNPDPKPESYSLESPDNKKQKQEHSLPGKNSPFLRLKSN